LTKLGIVVKRAVIAVLGTLVVLPTVLATFAWYSDRSVRADYDERVRDLSGDELIPKPTGSVTHAITIRRSALDVWPWLAQMGSGRAGWYAYDFIDNGGRPSAVRILPEFQNVGVGTVFPALPGAKDVFVVTRCEARAQPRSSVAIARRHISDDMGIRPGTSGAEPNTLDRARASGTRLQPLRPATVVR
jgi:hypothetical protein